MPPSSVFIDPETGELDTDQILIEAIPIAKLLALFVAVAIIPLLLTFIVSGILGLRWEVGLMNLVSQFILAVGTGVVLLHIITRAIELASEQ